MDIDTDMGMNRDMDSFNGHYKKLRALKALRCYQKK
jgi:hypothetical protein